MRQARHLAIVVLSILAAGCTRTPPTFRDVPPAQTGWTEGRRLWSEGQTLHVAIDADPQGLFVGRIDYEVYDGTLYLSTVRQSRPFAPSLFQIETAGLGLNEPWQQHVYWVADVKWDDVTKRAGSVGSKLGQRVDRVRADILDAPPTTQAAIATDTSAR